MMQLKAHHPFKKIIDINKYQQCNAAGIGRLLYNVTAFIQQFPYQILFIVYLRLFFQQV